MKIGLWSDAVNFPSLPLMKISAYHKEKGDTVKLADPTFPLERYDIAYISKTFNLPAVKKIPRLPYEPQADKTYYGGSGFATSVEGGEEVYNKAKDEPLPQEIENAYPDYTLYPELTKNRAYGFLTRGCPNNCGFCIVTRKEGRCSKQVASLKDFWQGQKEIKLMDANILACRDRDKLLSELVQSKAKIDYTQGLDARFVDDDTAKLICQTNIKMVHFAFVLIKNEQAILRGLETFKRHTTLTDRERKVYILTNYNTSHEEDWYRVRRVIELGYQPDVRIYQKGTHGQFLTDLQRWSNNSFLYRSCKFEDYAPRVDGKRCLDMYKSLLA